MKNSDIEMLRNVSHHCDAAIGLAIFRKGRRGVSEIVLHRLAKAGLVEVETHNVSAWNFGPPSIPYGYAHRHGQAAYDELEAANAAIEATLPATTMSNRSEIWVRITSLGRDALVTYG